MAWSFLLAKNCQPLATLPEPASLSASLFTAVVLLLIAASSWRMTS
jgi:hypothetical protein